MNQLFDMRAERPGYRLQQFELYNWGTFDSSSGQVFRFQPEGRTSLLVGHNGSGKSTLVDAITTLLGNNRNYNLAAGAKSRERTPKSYIKGAFDRVADESQSSVVRFLRPKGNHLSAISGVFHDERLDKTFTLTQILFLKSDGSDDKVYAIADSRHELKLDLQGLVKSDEVRNHLKRLGYQTTKSPAEYIGWVTKRTGMRGKAIDMFNQTVAVKNIHSLTGFIRDHMLESRNWREKISSLLTHFNDLSLAHQELERARRQEELLLPVKRHGDKFKQQSGELTSLESQLESAASFFPLKFIEIFEPEIENQKQRLAGLAESILRFNNELETQKETIRQLKNEIDQAGGERLMRLPELIEMAKAGLAEKRGNFQRFHDHLKVCQINDTVTKAEVLENTRKRLESTSVGTNKRLAESKIDYEKAIGAKASVGDQLRAERDELEALQRRRTNLPPRFVSMRNQICSSLNLDESALPFAAELISVAPNESRWESSAEMVLNSFALSLLVPDRYYQRVRSYLERNRINDEKGHGARIDYIRVGVPKTDSGDRIDTNSLINKLNFKPRHDLTPWVRGEVTRRFDFHCCENDDEFNSVPRMALTPNRHVKFSSELHKKDDRRRTVDPRYFVLGWDNTEKKKRISASITKLDGEYQSLTETATKCDGEITSCNEILRAIKEALVVTDFDLIDVGKHQKQILQLEQEKKGLEESNDAVKLLKSQLKTAEGMEANLNGRRDEQIGEKANLEKEVELVSANVASEKSKLAATQKSGQFKDHEVHFGSILKSLGEKALSIADFDSRRQNWEGETRSRVTKLRKPLDDLKEKLISAMGKFLREFKEEKDDLDSTVDALDSFLGLLERLQQEDLPQHIRKFKERLNDQVTQEVAQFNTSLRLERKEIENKIEQLNQALANVEYDRARGTYMRLDPRNVQDKEIEDFRRSLRECMDDSLESSDEANETRFLRIKALVEKLADKDKSSWRSKVIDVRNWFNFAALEQERESGKTLSCYDGSSGQSGGEKAKLAFTILVAALAYQFNVDPNGDTPGRFQFVVVDEMFSKVDDQNASYALQLFEQFGLQLLIVAPLDAKARITEPFVDRYLHVVKNGTTNKSQLYSMTAQEYDEVVKQYSGRSTAKANKTAKAERKKSPK